MSDFTFLRKDQVFKEKMLNIFKIRGANAETTDFAILLGARKSVWWTKDNYSLDLVETKTDSGNAIYDCRSRIVGARPVISAASLSDEFKNLTRKEDGIIEVECGEYPQTITSKEINDELENLYQKNALVKINKKYTVDKTDITEYSKRFEPKEIDEYIYKGKKYVRIEGNKNPQVELSNNEKIIIGKGYWVEVEPVKWLIDEETYTAVSEKVLFSGIRFDARRNYQNIFEETEVKKYMDYYFSKELEPSKVIVLNQENNKEKVKVKVKSK